MSVKELLEYRCDVWKEYYVSVLDKNLVSILHKAKILDTIDELLYKRINE
jgi:hypothetical protein